MIYVISYAYHKPKKAWFIIWGQFDITDKFFKVPSATLTCPKVTEKWVKKHFSRTRDQGSIRSPFFFAFVPHYGACSQATFLDTCVTEISVISLTIRS